jgi:predicted CXXCH cytochrome family protein
MCLNIRRPLLALLFMFLVAAAFSRSAPSVALLPASEPREPHDFRAYGMDCRSCHKSVGLKTSGNMAKSIREICHGCHSLDGLLSHPVDFKPVKLPPADLPLDEKGMMTCATCHDPHKTYRNATTGKKTMYLRRDGPQKIFCMACHSKA